MKSSSIAAAVLSGWVAHIVYLEAWARWDAHQCYLD